MNSSFKKNFKYIAVFVIALAAIAGFILNLDISGTTARYSLNDSPDMKAVFSDAVKNEKALVFEGDNDGVKYTWTYDAGKVKSARDTTLKIKPYEKFRKNVKKTLGSKNVFMFRYSKGINLNGEARLTIKSSKFARDSYLFKFANGRLSYVSSPALNEKDVTFDVKSTDGIYVLANSIDKKTLAKAKKKTIALKTKSSSERKKAEQETKNKKDKKTFTAKKKADRKRAAKKRKKTKGRIPKSKGKPIDLDDQVVNESKTMSCTLTVECRQALDNMDRLKEEKRKYVPDSGYIYGPRSVTFHEGENVYDVISREMRNHGIAFDADGYTKYSSAYVRGINNLYEFDCGKSSGWIYLVNGSMPNFGCSRYVLSEGDNVVWKYSVR